MLVGTSSDELRYRLGRPSNAMGNIHGPSVWAWRYESPFCQRFQVTVEPNGMVRDAVYGPDPVCDVNENDLF